METDAEILQARLIKAQAEVEDLQDQLSKSLQLRQEMARNTERIKEALVQWKKKHEALQRAHGEHKQRLEISEQEKSNMEREFQQYYKQWGEEIKARDREWEEKLSHTVPESEVETIKLEQARQLEAAQKKQLDALREEVARFQGQYMAERRDHELLKTSMERGEEEHAHTIRELGNQHKSLMEELLAKNRKLQALADDTHKDREIAEMRRTMGEQSLELRQCKEEVDQLRRDKVQAVKQREEVRRESERLRQEWSGKHRMAEADRQAFVRKSESLADELLGCKEQAMQLQAQIVRLQEENAALEKQIKLHKEENRLATEQFEQRAKHELQAHEHELRRYARQLEETNQRVAEVASDRDGLVHRLAYQERDAAESMQRLEADTGRRVNEVESSKAALKDEVARLTNALAHAEQVHAEEVDALRRDLENTRAEIRNLTMEKDQLDERLQGREHTLVQLKADYEARIHESRETESEYQLLQQKHRQAADRLHSIEVEHDAVVKERNHLRAELENIQQEVDQERGTHLQAMQRCQTTFHQERDILEQRLHQLERELTHTQTESKHVLAKLKKDKNRYKKMCVLLRNRVTDLTKDVSAVRKEHDVHMQTKQFEIRTLSKQLQEAERQRDELKMRMSVGAAFSMGGTSHGHVPPGASVLEQEANTHAEIRSLMSRLEAVDAPLAGMVDIHYEDEEDE